ncbi:MAG: hypothetical protein ACRC33_32135 [Gemmataceae bacterium]
MKRSMALVLVVLAAPLFAAEKAPEKPVGTWVREVDGHKLTYRFNDDSTMSILVETRGKKIDVAGSYGVTADGLVFGVMTKVETDLGAGPEKGDLFSFTFTITGKELTMSDLKGTKVNDGSKKLVEGAYTKK